MKATLLAVLFFLAVLPAFGAAPICQTVLGSNPKGQLGCSVQLHNGLAALGANLDGAGSLSLYRKAGNGTWTLEQRITASDGRPGDELGRSSGIDGDWLAVGAPFARSGRADGSGAVYVYHRVNGSWGGEQKLAASDAAQGDQFGITLALAGDTLGVGAPNATGNAGSLSGVVYVFRRNGETWAEAQKLAAGGAAPFDNFGFSLALDGSTLAVGAPFHDRGSSRGNAGTVYVFESDGTTWSQRSELTAADGAADDQFGSAVALSGGVLVVGARGDDVNGLRDAGSAYVYERRGGWSPADHLPGQAAGDYFGVSASLSGDRLLIGALLHNGSGPESGAAYLYTRQRTPDGTFRWQADGPPLLGDTEEDRFGQAVAIDGNDFAVGAYLGGGDYAGSARLCSLSGNPPPGIQIQKDDGQTEVTVDQTLTYVITVTNAGSQDAPAVQVTDTVSPKLRDVSWCIPGGQPACGSGNILSTVPLAAGAHITFNASGTVKHNASGTITNTACAQAPGGPQVCADDPPDRILPGPQPCTEADLKLVESVSPPGAASPGQRLTYTLTATNQGPCTATGVQIQAPVSPGLQPVTAAPFKGCSIAKDQILCHLPDLPVGKSSSVDLQFDVLCTCTAAIVSRATVSANETDPNPEDNASPEVSTALVRTANLALSKTAQACVKPGDPLPYSLTVTNLGPDCACGVVVSDPVPAGLACPTGCSEVRFAIAQLAAGASQTFPVDLTVKPATAGGSRIVNTATVSAVPPGADPQPRDDSGEATTTVAADVSITKTDGLATAAPGQTLLYTIVVNNPGGSPATVTDLFPAGLNPVRWCRDVGDVPCTPIHSGDLHDVLTDSTATYRVQGTVCPTFRGTLANTATVTASPPCGDANPGNDSATDITEIVQPPGVTVTCDGVVGPTFEGDVVTYTFRLENGGPAAQADNPGDEFTDLLPAGLAPVSASATSGTVTLGNPVTWNGAIPVGGTVLITIKAQIGPGTTGMTICNGAKVAFDRDGDGTNESGGTAAVPCCLWVPPLSQIPTLSGSALAALALLLALLALRRLSRPSPGR